MDSEQNITSDICAITGNNLEAVLFPDYSNQENMIVTSDINALSSRELKLFYSEKYSCIVFIVFSGRMKYNLIYFKAHFYSYYV